MVCRTDRSEAARGVKEDRRQMPGNREEQRCQDGDGDRMARFLMRSPVR